MNEPMFGSKGWKQGKLKGSRGLRKEGCSVGEELNTKGVLFPGDHAYNQINDSHCKKSKFKAHLLLHQTSVTVCIYIDIYLYRYRYLYR